MRRRTAIMLAALTGVLIVAMSLAFAVMQNAV